MELPSVSVIVLAYGPEPWLGACVDALAASKGLDGPVEIVLVDNGCTSDAVDRVAEQPGLKVVRPPENLGFAGGCNFGATHASGDVLVFVNSDAIVDPGAVAALADVAQRASVGIATGSIRLADRPHLLNSGGNEVHFLGMGWAGHFGEPASDHATPRSVTAASGAGMAMSRAQWDRLGGFEAQLFAYHEDAELSLRCWQLGLTVTYVPDAAVFHHYEFSRNPLKLYLLERNRLIFVLTLYERRTLVLLAPALAAFELAMLAAAISGGWGRQKLQGWMWLARNRRWLVERRRAVQAQRAVPDAELATLLVGRLKAGNLPLPAWLGPLDAAVSGYWRATRVCLGRPPR